MDNYNHSPRKMLLVEDEALVAMIVVDTLTELGFDVIEAATARDALDRADADQPISNSPSSISACRTGRAKS